MSEIEPKNHLHHKRIRQKPNGNPAEHFKKKRRESSKYEENKPSLPPEIIITDLRTPLERATTDFKKNPVDLFSAIAFWKEFLYPTGDIPENFYPEAFRFTPNKYHPDFYKRRLIYFPDFSKIEDPYWWIISRFPKVGNSPLAKMLLRSPLLVLNPGWADVDFSLKSPHIGKTEMRVHTEICRLRIGVESVVTRSITTLIEEIIASYGSKLLQGSFFNEASYELYSERIQSVVIIPQKIYYRAGISFTPEGEPKISMGVAFINNPNNPRMHEEFLTYSNANLGYRTRSIRQLEVKPQLFLPV